MPHKPELKAIPTKYKGYTFRSRLEARWAVFMDHLDIKWEYEHEGYDLGGGIWYLPDFWLPTFNYEGCFLEVKPFDFLPKELEKAYKLSLAAQKIVILAEGVPDYKCQRFIFYELCKDELNYDICHGLMNADRAEFENRIFIHPGYEKKDLTISERDYDFLGSKYLNAVEAAKGASF